MINYYTLRYSGSLLAIAMFSNPNIAQVEIKYYEFKLIQDQLKKGRLLGDVTLLHIPDNHAFPEAIIFS